MATASIRLYSQVDNEKCFTLQGLADKLEKQKSVKMDGHKVIGVCLMENVVLVEQDDKTLVLYDFQYYKDDDDIILDEAFSQDRIAEFDNWMRDELNDQPIGIKLGDTYLINADWHQAQGFSKVGALISFDCVSNLFGDDIKSCKIVHYTGDESFTRPKLNRESILKRMKEGFTPDRHTLSDLRNNPRQKAFTGITFHKSGNVLLKHGRNTYGIFGFDDGQYFGCELPAGVSPETCSEGLECLRPADVPITAMRQGEWFFMKVADEAPVHSVQLPSEVREALVMAMAPKTTHYDSQGRRREIKSKQEFVFYLPLDDVDSNQHTVTCERFAVGNDAFYAMNFSCTHLEHPTIKGNGWYKIVKNLAVRSVSAEGVD